MVECAKTEARKKRMRALAKEQVEIDMDEVDEARLQVGDYVYHKRNKDLHGRIVRFTGDAHPADSKGDTVIKPRLGPEYRLHSSDLERNVLTAYRKSVNA